MTEKRPPQIRAYPDLLFRDARLGSPFDVSTSIEQGRELARRMADTAFDNLAEFPYVYLTSGATEAMDLVLPRHKVAVNVSDYRYAGVYRSPTAEVNLDYWSYPFAGDGTFSPIPDNGRKVFLDCSYMFASHMEHIRRVPENVAYLAFSLSKSHNVADFRIGWLMTKAPLQPTHLVQYDYSYGPSRHAEVLRWALNFKPNYLYLKNRPFLSALYAKHGLIENATNLFGVSPVNGIRHPYYLLSPNA